MERSAFVLDGKILIVMAAFKAHAALNFWRGQEIGDGSAKAGAMGQFGKLQSVSTCQTTTNSMP